MKEYDTVNGTFYDSRTPEEVIRVLESARMNRTRLHISLGETDDFSYNITADPVHVHDLQATILHLLGIDHKRLTYKFQGRYFRLTDVHGELVEKLLA